tara:strand:+ start:272 stop:535 length:264 start_codon:yes stop_codon:yes gene_type:complete
MTNNDDVRVYLMQLQRNNFPDLGWGLVKREAFGYLAKNETLDGFDVHLMELRAHIELSNDRKAKRQEVAPATRPRQFLNWLRFITTK